MRSSWHNFFETNNGTIKCCGWNYYGQLGLGYIKFEVTPVSL